MELELLRYSSQGDSTLGLLFDASTGFQEFLCFILEDEHRDVKVAGETRIPEGRYKLELRAEGGMHGRYTAKFPEFHLGMLWIRDVPAFTFCYLHIGNDDDDTDGCPLVGDTAVENLTEPGMVGRSAKAYCRVYPVIAKRISAGEEVWIRIHDYDRKPGGV